MPLPDGAELASPALGFVAAFLGIPAPLGLLPFGKQGFNNG